MYIRASGAKAIVGTMQLSRLGAEKTWHSTDTRNAAPGPLLLATMELLFLGEGVGRTAIAGAPVQCALIDGKDSEPAPDLCISGHRMLRQSSVRCNYPGWEPRKHGTAQTLATQRRAYYYLRQTELLFLREGVDRTAAACAFVQCASIDAKSRETRARCP